MTRGMICFASEQVWPNLLGFYHEQVESGGVDVLAIYHTDDEKRSAGPARRLKAFFKKAFPKTPVTRLVGEMLPEAVSKQCQQFMQSHPADEWVVNFTGGTKLITLGAATLLRRPDTRGLYLELSHGQWYDVRQHMDTLAASPVAVDPSLTDRIPVVDLVALQITTETHRWVASDFFRIPPNKWDAALKTWGGSLPNLFEKASMPGPLPDEGFLFEHLMANVLWRLGCDNVVVSLIHEPRERSGQEVEMEFDVVANHGGRLVLIDCKTGKGVNTEFLRGRQSSVRLLGGLNALCIQAAPGLTAELKYTAARNVGITLLGRDECGHIFKSLAEAIGLPAPPAAAEWDRALGPGLQALGSKGTRRSDRRPPPRKSHKEPSSGTQKKTSSPTPPPLPLGKRVNAVFERIMESGAIFFRILEPQFGKPLFGFIPRKDVPAGVQFNPHHPVACILHAFHDPAYELRLTTDS